MFERFTSHARRVLALAQEEARFLGHNHCGSEHLLLGLIRDEGPAGAALQRQGIALDSARKAVSNLRGRDSANLAHAGSGSLPFSANAKAAVQAAVHDANASQSSVDSNHLLFGVLRDQSPAVQAVLQAIRSGGQPAAQPPLPASASLPPPPPVQPAAIFAAPAPAPAPAQPVDTASLGQRVDELTRRVDHLQAMVNQLSQVSTNNQR